MHHLAATGDQRLADDFVVDTWELVDLSPLADDTRRLEFNLESTDVGPFGPNTPFYFAADNLVISDVQDAVVPEPSSLAALLFAALIGLATLRFKRAPRLREATPACR